MQEEPTRPQRVIDNHYQYPAGQQPSPPPPALRPPERKKRRRRFWGCLQTVVAITLMIVTVVVGIGLIAGLVMYRSLSGELEADMEKLQSLEGVEDFETTRIYAQDGTLLYEIIDEGRRTEVPLDRISQYVIMGTVATEDDSFYENVGFDPQSIMRAAYQWYQEGEIVSGASTITQQLVKQIVFSYEERNEQTLRRKLKEAALAYVMTQQFSKDEILELYLNEVYYGNLAYGIEGASNVYFDKSAADLTLGEASFLVGLVQSPSTYDPYSNFAAAKTRQYEVLSLMVLHGYLTQTEVDQAFNSPPLTVYDLQDPDVPLIAPHFTVEVRRELGELPGIDPVLIQRGGLRIYTTIDLDMQDMAQAIVEQHVTQLRDEYNLHNAALVAINPYTGEVLALVGSVDYEDDTIDGNVNVILSPQQPGSSIKPLTYALALEQGMQAADIVWDVPMGYGVGFDEYQPQNYDGRFHGPVRLRDALANSYNIPAVTMLDRVGVANLLDFANRLGIESLSGDAAQYGLSLTLGGGELFPIDLTSAYAVFANGGYKIDTHLINRVEDDDGNVLYEATNRVGEKVLDPRISFVISDILSDNRARTPAMGTDSPLRLPFPAAAKTGTTNEYRDNWTIGYTPHLVVGVWAGNTDNSPMAEGTSGLTGAAPIWHDFMEQVYGQGLAGRLQHPGVVALQGDFVVPVGLEQNPVCYITALRDPLLAEEGCAEHRSEWFIIREDDDTQPAEQPTPTAVPPTDEAGQPLPPSRIEIEPGLFMIAVLPLDETLQGAIHQIMLERAQALPEGLPPLAPPLYCEVPSAYGDREGVVRQLFIKAPSRPNEAVRAYNWAVQNQRPIEPTVICPEEVIEQALGPDVPPAEGVMAYTIISPKANEGVYGLVPIMGTALFDPSIIQFYKMEISGPIFDGWVTFGETHPDPVENGLLEELHTEGLTPGEYKIRLVLVGPDSNYIQPPYEVTIIVLSEPPTPTPGS